MKLSLLKKLMDWLFPTDALNDRCELDVLPSNAASTTLTSGNATWGSYAQIVASTSYDYMLVGLLVHTLSNLAGIGTVAIATGASGSESDKAKVPVIEAGATNVSHLTFIRFKFPIPIITATRIAARFVHGTDATTCQVKLVLVRGITDKINS